ncbi:MAG: methyltransferase domain-containing protein [Terracidiphilus sp.]|nr:methyltransferase domain-containing protein [Terracidiphilus sp.]
MSNQLPEFDPAIAGYYSHTPEDDRLAQGPSLLEALRTRELIERHAPAPPATVLDIGGGAGAYALWLAERGYSVHLIDPIPRHVAEAQRRSNLAAQPLASCAVGDARNLPFADAIADLVLLLGPLYHLVSAQDRAGALDQAVRVVKPGGLLCAAAISCFASSLDGLARDLFRDPQFAAMAERDLRDGQHRNPSSRPDYFTTAYFHRPEDLRAEVLDAGLELTGLFGIEGPGWILPDIAERLADDRRRHDLLRVARMLEAEPSMLASSAHLLVVARKPA